MEWNKHLTLLNYLILILFQGALVVTQNSSNAERISDIESHPNATEGSSDVAINPVITQGTVVHTTYWVSAEITSEVEISTRESIESTAYETTNELNTEGIFEYATNTVTAEGTEPTNTVATTQSPICGGNITAENGTIQSPNYPNNYDNNERCTWYITVPGKHRVELKFDTFRLESSSSCDYDTLIARDGTETGTSLGTFCGESLPSTVRSLGNTLYLFFKSDGSTTYKGFSAKFSKGMMCGGYITSENGTVKSPNYPKPYDNNEICSWFITVPEGNRIELRFENFKLESSSSCQYDYLEVRDGAEGSSASLGKFCGSSTPNPIRSMQNKMRLTFRTDGSNTLEGFLASFSTIASCSENITSDNGTIQSPNYPSNYFNAEQCTWLITVSENYVIQLLFDTFTLETASSCQYDFLDIRDGPNIESTRLGKFCGSSLPETIRTSGNTAFLHFKSDNSNTFRGFSLNFTKVRHFDPFPTTTSIPTTVRSIATTMQSTTGVPLCGGDFTGLSGVIKSPYYPGNYPSNIRCMWTITVPDFYQIELSFDDFRLEDSSGCAYDYLEVRDGSYPYSSVLGKLCGSSIPRAIQSTGNTMHLTFRTDGSSTYRGFSAKYTEVLSCRSSINADRGYISSPNYPQNYPGNERCIWFITVPGSSQVVLRFNSFHLEAEVTCNHDFVEVLDGHNKTSNVLGKFCGTEIPEDTRSTGPTMAIKFVSDSSFSFKGFSAVFASGDLVANHGDAAFNISTSGIKFHDVHGTNILIYNASTVAMRPKSYCRAITFSNRRIKVNEHIHVQILSRSRAWAGTIRIGFTASNPLNLRSFMDRCIEPYQFNGLTWSKSIDPTYAEPNSVFFFYYTENGTVFVGREDKEDTPLLTNIDATLDLWAVFNVYGQTEKIKLLEVWCSSSTCENGGTCSKDEHMNIIQCICPHGYKGKKCEKKIFCDSYICKNEGTCSQEGMNGVFQCSCARGFKGLSCEEEINDFSSLMVEYIDIIGVLLGIILLIIIIFVAIRIWRSKKEERMREQIAFPELLKSDTIGNDTM